jgi:ribosomal protein S18 acetylase RimI-like enzyme
VQIQRAQEGDIDQMVELDALIIGDTSRRDLIEESVKKHQGYVARHQSQIVGFLLSHRHFFSQPFIELLIVHPAFRQQGIGTALMRQAEAQYRPGKLFTSTNLSNIPMQRLCERLGYVRSGIIEHLDEGDPELIYFKPLSASSTSGEEIASLSGK